MACAGGRAPASPAPARRCRAPGGAARAPRPALDSRWRSAPGASSPGGNNGAKAGAPEAGRGEGSRTPPGVSRPCGPPLQTRRRLLTILAARAPSPCGGPGAAAFPRAVLVPGALRGAPPTGEKSAVSAAFPAAARARGRRRRGRRNALSGVSVPSGRCRPALGTAPAPPRAAVGPEYGLPLAAACYRGHQCPQERSERYAPARREGSLSHSHPALVPPPPPPLATACWAL